MRTAPFRKQPCLVLPAWPRISSAARLVGAIISGLGDPCHAVRRAWQAGRRTARIPRAGVVVLHIVGENPTCSMQRRVFEEFHPMNDSPGYTPPKVWQWNKENGGRFANINRPIAGSTHEKELPVGKHPFQLYSLATPNGVKVTTMFEELLAAGHKGAEYDAWLINIGQGDQFGSGFVDVNPNSKIPALMDRSGPTPIRVF